MSRRLAIALGLLLTIGAFAGSTAILLSVPTARAASLSITLYGRATTGWSLTPGGETNPGPILSVNAGDTVTFRLVSEDGMSHALFVDLDDNSAIGAGDISSPQGTDVTFTVTIPNAPGSHYYYCTIHSGDLYGDYQPGALMHGTFNVNGAPAATFAAPTSATSWSGASAHPVRFNLADEDAPSSLTVWVNYTYNGGTQGGSIAGPISGTANPNVVSWTTPGINAADIVVNVTAKDASGAVGSTKSAPFEIDSARPIIVGRNPAPNAIGVPRSQTVRVTWSEPMNATASGAANAFAVDRMTDGAWIPGTVTWSPDRTQATFTPAAPWDATMPFEVRVNATSKDDSDPGNTVIGPSAWTFTTGTALDTTRPTVADAAAIPGSRVGGGIVTIQANVTDDLSIASVSAQVAGPATDLNLTMANTVGPTWTVARTYPAAGTYTFIVWAIDGSGNANSSGGTFSIAPAPLPVPSGVSAALDSTGAAVVVTWSALADPNVTGYHVYRSPSAGGPYTKLTSSPVSASGPLRHTDGTVQAGATYYYAVTSVDAAGAESAFSPESAITVPSAGPAPPDVTLAIAGVLVGVGIVLAVAFVFFRRRRRGKPAK